MQFQEYLDLYGADLVRWPVELRAAAEKAMSGAPELQRSLQQAQAFEARLQSVTIPEPRADLADGIIRRSRQIPKRYFVWAPMLAFAMLFLCGFVMGFAVMQKTTIQHTVTSTNLNDFLYESDGVSQ